MTTPLSTCRDENCPECDWPETYAEGTIEEGPKFLGCRKCGWRQEIAPAIESGLIVIDTPDGIAFARLASLKGALSLEMKGLTRKGRSAYAVLKDMGYSGNRAKVLAAVQADIDRALGR